MSNVADAKATREEEIAFLAMERVLGVDIKLADAGTGDRKPDGTWTYPDGQGRHGIVEITSPPAAWLLRQLARAKKAGAPHIESGSFPLRWGELALVCAEMLATPWATENIDKLLGQPADERHLFLFGRRHADQAFFRRLSEPRSDDTVETHRRSRPPAWHLHRMVSRSRGSRWRIPRRQARSGRKFRG